MSKAKVVVAEPQAGHAAGTWARRPWLAVVVAVALVIVVYGAGHALGQLTKSPVPKQLAACHTSAQLGPHQFAGPQPFCIDRKRNYQATLVTTQGNVVISLLPGNAPNTVNNFIVLALNGYYDGMPFWKAEDWVVQSGDPLGNGRGGPGYDLADEPTPGLNWDLGSVGMARVPGGAVNGSQFFIMKAAWPSGGPDAEYNRFGTVTAGLDKVQLIAATDHITSVRIAVR